MFNPQKPFGKFSPPWRGVFYEQNGRYYTKDHQEVDQDGRPIEVENGKSEDYGLPEPEQIKNGDAGEGIMIPLDDLLEKVNMPFMAFKKAARAHLGDATPALKADIIAALKVKAAAAQKVPPPPPNGAPAPSKASTTKETVASNGVDIVAWVDKRIAKQYLMGDVYKAIKLLYNKVVSNERDAVNFLIDEGVIAPEFARNAGSALTWDGMQGGQG